MAKLKVSIINNTTLKLDEEGHVGDIIDLKELQTVDNSILLQKIKDSNDETYKNLLNDEKKRFVIEKELVMKEAAANLTAQLSKSTTDNLMKMNVLKEENIRLQSVLEAERQKLQIQTESIKKSLMGDFELEKQKLQDEISKLNELMQSKVNEAVNKEIFMHSKYEQNLKDQHQKQITQLNNEVLTLKGQIESKEKSALLEINIAKQELEKHYSVQVFEKENRINELILEIQKMGEKEKMTIFEKQKEVDELRNQIKSTNEIKNSELEIIKLNLVKKYTEELAKKDSKIDKLNFKRSSLQIKVLGEELERWCNSEFDSYALSGFEDCDWKKDNVVVKDSFDNKATKADYIFEVYASEYKNPAEKLLSVCCEMKNESPDTKIKTKNSDHYKKLDNDRIKKGCQYSLLISELEWDSANDVPIKKVHGYENMYMVRPAYFISFLSLIKSLAKKYQLLTLARKHDEEAFEEGQKIIDEFENMKRKYLDSPLLSLQREVEDIKKEAQKIYDSSNKIISATDTIISNKISEIKIKIERFDIKKITKKLDKLN